MLRRGGSQGRGEQRRSGQRRTGQRGSIPILLLWITVGFMLLIAISYDFLAVFVARRVSQKAADAAAIASADKWHEQAKADGEAEARVRFERFKHDMAGAAKELREDYIRSHIHTDEVRDDLLAGRPPSIEALVVEFISPKDAGCIAFGSGTKAHGGMETAADYYATANGANGLERGVAYPIVFDGVPRIQVTAITRLHLGIFDHALDEAHRQVRANAYAGIQELGPVVIEWTSGCGGS